MMHDQLSSGFKFFILFSEPSHACIFSVDVDWQVMWILEQSMVARLCDKYHNIVLARLQFALTNV